MPEDTTERLIIEKLTNLTEKMEEVIERSIRLEEKHDAKDKLFELLEKRVSRLEAKVEKQGLNIMKVLTMLGSGGAIGYVVQQFMQKGVGQ